MKKLTAFILVCLVTVNICSMNRITNLVTKATRKAGKVINPDALVTQKEEIDRSIGIFKEFVDYLRTKKLDDTKRDPQFLERIYQINCRSYQVGETIKGCIEGQRYVESSKAREILINHPLASSPFIAWLTYKALYEDGRISKETFEQYCKIEAERFYFMLTTLIPKEDKDKFTKASNLLKEKETTVTVKIVDSTKNTTSNSTPTDSEKLDDTDNGKSENGTNKTHSSDTLHSNESSKNKVTNPKQLTVKQSKLDKQKKENDLTSKNNKKRKNKNNV